MQDNKEDTVGRGGGALLGNLLEVESLLTYSMMLSEELGGSGGLLCTSCLLTAVFFDSSKGRRRAH